MGTLPLTSHPNRRYKQFLSTLTWVALARCRVIRSRRPNDQKYSGSCRILWEGVHVRDFVSLPLFLSYLVLPGSVVS
ncbi:hypothetical protein BD310DRAFT_941786 [Dichomitus squalens]|uniref:Uncharacterized protein n=1 Tax=Dichomitus squalens TaxID=114155 RepID=A0A4Q9PGM9_9APHY|nr:hypothetical protein BD310DRAFT_941786 [Dichomitus squalens]